MHDRSAGMALEVLLPWCALQTPHLKLCTLVSPPQVVFFFFFFFFYKSLYTCTGHTIVANKNWRQRRPGNGDYCVLLQCAWAAQSKTFLTIMEEMCPPSLTPLQMVINALWLVPLRLFLLVFPATILGGISTAIITLCERFDEDDPHPLRGWRK